MVNVGKYTIHGSYGIPYSSPRTRTKRAHCFFSCFREQGCRFGPESSRQTLLKHQYLDRKVGSCFLKIFFGDTSAVDLFLSNKHPEASASCLVILRSCTKLRFVKTQNSPIHWLFHPNIQQAKLCDFLSGHPPQNQSDWRNSWFPKVRWGSVAYNHPIGSINHLYTTYSLIVLAIWVIIYIYISTY